MSEYTEEYKKETYKLIICAPDDPHRCPCTTKDGNRQCGYRAVQFDDGTYGKHCIMHGGSIEKKSNIRQEQRNYNLGKWQAKVNAFADNSQVKSLREELGLMRILLENIAVGCKDGYELEAASPRLQDLVMKIEKLVLSCHRLEASTGMLLDKTSALHIASRIVDIISKHVEDSDSIDKISEEIIAVIIGQKTEQQVK